MDGEAALDRVSGQVPAVAGGEQGRFRFRGDFGEPFAQVAEERRGERGDPLLASLAVACDVRAGAEMQVGAGEGGSSDTRSPVMTARWNMTRSRRPVRVRGLGAAIRASASSWVSQVTMARSARLAGMARMRAMSPACSGQRRAA